MTDNIIVLNADAYWASMTKTSPMSGKYQIDLCNLSDAAVDALKEVGIPTRNRDDKPEQGTFITCKSNNTMRYYDKNGEDISGILIGNGSKVKAVVKPYDWTSPTGQKGRSPSLVKLVVTDLVSYEEDGEAPQFNLDEAL